MIPLVRNSQERRSGSRSSVKKGRRWLRELFVRKRGYFRPSFRLGSQPRAGIIATVYFQNSIYNHQYPKDPENKTSPIFKKIYLFIYLIFGCVGSSFLCEGFLYLWQAGATLHCGARASHYRGLSCWEHRLQTRRLSICGSRAQLLRGMWDHPKPGLEPVSPALADRFSTTAPPGKPQNISY